MISQTKEKFNLVCYRSEQIPSVWSAVKDHIQLALDQGSDYNLNDILTGLCNKTMQLWCWQSDCIEGVLVTTIQTDDNSKFCLFLALGGKYMTDWIEYLPIVEEWARGEGCDEMRIYGRISWSRLIGYTIDYAKMSRKL